MISDPTKEDAAFCPKFNFPRVLIYAIVTCGDRANWSCALPFNSAWTAAAGLLLLCCATTVVVLKI